MNQRNIQRRLKAEAEKLTEMEFALAQIPQEEYSAMEIKTRRVGMSYNNTYLFMQGHCIYNLVCRIGASLTATNAESFGTNVTTLNLMFDRYTEIKNLTSDIRKQLA